MTPFGDDSVDSRWQQGGGGSASAVDCRRTRKELQSAWCDGRLEEALRVPEELADPLGIHLAGCPGCLREARSLERVDRFLAESFGAVERSVARLGEDRIAAMLRSVAPDPRARDLRRMRRSVNTLLWMAFFLLSLLACSAIGLLTYHILFQR